jgi:hypothetical protein
MRSLGETVLYRNWAICLVFYFGQNILIKYNIIRERISLLLEREGRLFMRNNSYKEVLIYFGLTFVALIAFAVINFYLNGGPQLVEALGL